MKKTKYDPTGKYQLYTVQQFSTLCKIPCSTLRYYDDNDIFHPTYVDSETGYRYYTILGLEDLGTIQTLQEMGMSLSEIKDYFNHRTFFSSYRMLSRQYEKIAEQCQRYEQLKKYLSEKIHALNSVMQKTDYEIQIKTFPDRYGYTNFVDCKTESDTKYESSKIMGHYDKHLFISNSFAIILPREEFEQKRFKDHYYCMLMDIAREETEQIHKLFFPAGTYLCLQYFGSSFDRVPSLERLYNYIQENNITILGDIIQVCIIDENITNHDDEKISELQLQIKI